MPERVRILDGSPETRAKFNLMKEALKLYHPEERIKTGEDAILYVIRKIPELENENIDLKKRIKELERKELEQ